MIRIVVRSGSWVQKHTVGRFGAHDGKFSQISGTRHRQPHWGMVDSSGVKQWCADKLLVGSPGHTQVILSLDDLHEACSATYVRMVGSLLSVYDGWGIAHSPEYK